MSGPPGELPTGVHRVVATAPVRVADVGGWTDTWFGSPGRVCHLAVGPGVCVEAGWADAGASPADGTVGGTGGGSVGAGGAAGAPVGVGVGAGDRPVRVVAPMLGEDYRVGPSPERGWGRPVPGRHPLLEHAVGAALEGAPEVAGRAIEITITSEVPPGASLGTSAAVVVAVLGALDGLLRRNRPAADLAALAHEVETARAGRESGVQDQWAAAVGGCGLLAVGPFPQVRHRAVPLAPATTAELEGRLVTVVFGPHDSSTVHAEVIDAVVGCGGAAHDRARTALRRLSSLADDAAAALRSGSVDGWAATLTAATEAQRDLHPRLVGTHHAAAIEVARSCGARGWKVNGAGGDGGSLTVVADGPDGAARLATELCATDRSWTVVPLWPARGLEVVAPPS